MKAGTRRLNAGHGQQVDGNWEGVIRDKNKVIWSCGHQHGNRDHYSRLHGKPARQCAEDHLAEIAKQST